MLTEADLVGYLLQSGLLDNADIVGGELKITDMSRHNCNFGVSTDLGETILREAIRSPARRNDSGA